MARYFHTRVSDETKRQIGTGPLDLKFYQAYNNDSTKAFIQFFDAQSADVTVGTTAPDLVFVLPADNGNTFTLERGIRFSTGCTYAITSTRTGNDAITTDADVTAIYGD